MTGQGFAFFDTPLGRCAIAWGERGVIGVVMPEAREADTRRRLLRRFPGATESSPPEPVQRALDHIASLLRGEPGELSAVPLDMERVPPFHRRVYEAARSIPPGATVSYGDLAARLGSAGSARAVGQALGRNPFPIVVPCHRVLAADGRIGGFSAAGGIATKLRLLAIERVSGAPGDPGEVPGFDAGAAAGHLRSRDPALARVIDAVGPLRLRIDRTQSVFRALAEAIVYQQLTGRAAATIFARVQALFPRANEGFTAEQILRASDEKLRGAGLSRAKLLALRDLAARERAGEIPSLAEIQRMDDDAIVEQLTRVRGIGRWTVEMLLIFRLGRPDVLPVDDYGVRKGFAAAFRRPALPKPVELARRGERWRPNRSAASWYLWRAAERAAGT